MPDALFPDRGPAPQVLARKYRPQTFADLVGQEAMVRVLEGAFATGRVAQAFMLTGIRGTGKTTTARILAKGLNCVGPDGRGGPTTRPCGVCAPCVAIAEGRHVDVLEIDAASNTGVQNVRDVIIDTVAYAPTQARTKVFIIDEVHQLSASAFNALLKTLEEPPPHVKFILATTEIRKVPVTVLSRCQRFDLRRIPAEAMGALLRRIAAAEGAAVEDGAVALIVRAAEGSARDATSLLDQAIGGGGPATAEAVRRMLGLADRGRVLDLLEMVLRGDAAGALAELRAQHADGAEASAVLRDLAEAVHWLSVLKVAPGAEDPGVPAAERARGEALAAVPVRVLARAWQMLLKALEEVAAAPDARMAAEMAVIRLTHVADLPSPEDLVRQLQGGPAAPSSPRPAPGGASGDMVGGTSGHAATSRPTPPSGQGPTLAARAALARPSPGPQPAPDPVPVPSPLDRFARFEDVVALIREGRDMALLVEVEQGVRLARYQPGRIEFEPAPGAARDLAQRLGARLQGLTGGRWGVSVVSEGGAPTLAEAEAAARGDLHAQAMAHPLVRAALDAFPGARLRDVRVPAPAGESAAGAPAEEAEDFDPFEE